MMFSESRVRPLGGNQTQVSSYPADMPERPEELSGMWSWGPDGPDENYSRFFGGRMVAFVPNSDDWRWVESWNRYFPFYSAEMGTDLPDHTAYETSLFFIDQD